MKQSNVAIRDVDDGVIFSVKVVPGSSRAGICGVLGGKIKIKITAPPEKGKANQSLIDFLAKKLGLKKNQIRIMSGQTKKVKQIRLSSISAETILKKLELNK